MCRIEETVYVGKDGHRAVYPETYHCERGRRFGRICADAKVRTREYRTGSSHEPTSSPIPSSPLTPSGPGFNTRARRPSTSSRPSTRDGPVKVTPEIVIEFGSKKGKGKSYHPTVSISTKGHHRSSLGSGSNVDSLDSEASHAIRTGFPDVPPPTLSATYAVPDGLLSRPRHPRNKSSDESYTDQAPSLYSGYDSPPSLATTASSGTRPIIHNGQRHVPSPINTVRGQTDSPSSPYRTTVVTPRGVYEEDTERKHHSTAPQTASAAPEITGRGEERERRRAENRRQQEALDREVAANLIREENKHVRFETSRAQDRAEQRADKTFAARADGRERIRQQERQEREKDVAAKEAAARKAKSSTKASKPPAPSRRNSVRMTSAEVAKQQELIEAEARQMRKERINADALEREEQMQQQPTLQQQQQDPRYYDPRAGKPTMPSSQVPLPRRGSLSAQRPDLSRPVPQPRQDRRPPVSFPSTFNARVDLPARDRRPSSSHGAGPVNPFATVSADPWDVRNVRDALPNARGPNVGHVFPQQASHRMNQAFYQGEYETDSEDERHDRRRRRE